MLASMFTQAAVETHHLFNSLKVVELTPSVIQVVVSKDSHSHSDARLTFPQPACQLCFPLHLTMDTKTKTDDSPDFFIFQPEDMGKALQPQTQDEPRKKRVHRKSRLGCQACKRRRVKVGLYSNYTSITSNLLIRIVRRECPLFELYQT